MEGNSGHGLREAYRRGFRSVRIRSHGDGVRKAFLLAVAIVVAWNSPVAWYWKIAIFLALMFVIGCVVQVFAMRRERRERGMPSPNTEQK